MMSVICLMPSFSLPFRWALHFPLYIVIVHQMQQHNSKWQHSPQKNNNTSITKYRTSNYQKQCINNTINSPELDGQNFSEKGKSSLIIQGSERPFSFGHPAQNVQMLREMQETVSDERKTLSGYYGCTLRLCLAIMAAPLDFVWL